MLTHHQRPPAAPARVVVIGAAGFVGRTTMRNLGRNGIAAVGIGRAEVDLLHENAAEQLASHLRPGDAVVVIAARAPAKNTSMVLENVRMMESICRALCVAQPSHVVYVSSDAVYADSHQPLTEESPAEPGSLHGAMHLVRELMLENTVSCPFCILRPTLLYGAEDPHNGYGPNSFRRLAAAGKDISLYGEGEERRDHVYVEDVAEIIRRVLLNRSSGKLNVASGTVTSFREIAEKVVGAAGANGRIRNSPRNGPMPHNGYRAFDASSTMKSFPDFRYTALDDGLELSGEPKKSTRKGNRV